jgi:hypothetical protein
MVHVLVVQNKEARLDATIIADRTKEQVRKNSIPEEGIAIFDCGEGELESTIPWDWAEQIIQVGECIMEMKVEPSVIISADGDAEMQLVLYIQDILNGEVEQEDSVE